ncbi:MAG: hypothetical protein OXP09_18930 [Gammaproteobacteria bacterium]|nr:hypothetical protein [Gammaproteobacteria bacterium]
MSLPPEFAELLPFEDKWALRSEAERQGARLASDMEDIRAFYTAMQARVDDILTLLADHDPADLPGELKPLFYLTLSYCEVAPAVELFRQPAVVDGFEPRRLVRVEIPNMTPPDV